MTNIMVIGNQKGGIGKSFTCAMFANLLSTNSHERVKKEYHRTAERVLLIDTDSQADSTFILTRQEADYFNDRNLYNALIDQDATDYIYPVSDTLHVLPGSAQLAMFDDLFAAAQKQIEQPEKMLENALRPVANQYDWIIIDTPPALSRIQAQALNVSLGYITNVIIPLQTKRLGRDSILRYAHTLNEVKANTNPNLHIAGVMPILTDTHARVDKHILDSAREMFDDLVMQTVVRRRVSLEDMVEHGFSEKYAHEREALEDFYSALKEVRAYVERTKQQRIKEYQ